MAKEFGIVDLVLEAARRCQRRKRRMRVLARCALCGYRWILFREFLPLRCPNKNCGTRLWDGPYVHESSRPRSVGEKSES